MITQEKKVFGEKRRATLKFEQHIGVYKMMVISSGVISKEKEGIHVTKTNSGCVINKVRTFTGQQRKVIGRICPDKED